jgi:CheY-like chemotaxis protein
MTNRVRACLADDDELIASTRSLVLKQDGYDVGAAASPNDIVAKLTS